MCVDVEPGMRTAAAVAWEAAAKISLLVLALSLLDRGCCSSVYCSSTGCCSSTCCCCCCCCCGRCSSTRRWWSTGSHPTESLVEQDCVSSGYWLCVSWAESSCPTESRREKTTKNQQLTLKIHVSVVCTCTFWYGTTHGPARQIHGPAHVIVGPAHIEPVSHGPRCHVMGRAGPGRDF